MTITSKEIPIPKAKTYFCLVYRFEIVNKWNCYEFGFDKAGMVNRFKTWIKEHPYGNINEPEYKLFSVNLPI